MPAQIENIHGLRQHVCWLAVIMFFCRLSRTYLPIIHREEVCSLLDVLPRYATGMIGSIYILGLSIQP